MEQPDLTWLPAWQLHEMIGTRALSPVELAEHTLARIERLDPSLGAIEHLDVAQVRADAKAAEKAMLGGGPLGALHGIPVAVKSHLDIAGRPETMPFGTGVAATDDLVVERLRAAGAVIVGHTNMPVMRRDGTYDHEATARNPWDRTRTPGISSAGSAAAVAAGMLPVAVGSDGGGSSRLPAAYSGVLGLHTTAGAVPWVNSKKQSAMGGTATIGPISRDARDAAIVAAVISGPDGRDEIGLPFALPDPMAGIGDGISGLRMAWSDDLGFARAYAVEETEAVISAVREAASRMEQLGARVQPTSHTWLDPVVGMRLKYASDGIASMGIVGDVSTPAEAHAAAIATRTENWRRFAAMFAEHDVLLCPTIGSIAPTVEQFATQVPSGMSIVDASAGVPGFLAYTVMFNWLRMPAVSVPCGFVQGLPVGLQVVGPSGSEALLLRVAHAFLHAFPAPHPPV